MWLPNYHQPNVRQRTYERTKSLIKHAKTIGDTPLRALTPDNLQSLYNAMAAAGFSGNTIHKVHVMLYSALQRAVINRYVLQNVATMVEPPKFEKKEIEVFTTADVSLLLSAAADHRHYPLLPLAFTSGMRLGELLGLRWQDIIGNEIFVRQTLQRTVEKGFIAGPPKTNAGKRKIPVPAGTIAALEKHRKWWAESRLAHPTNDDDPFKDLIFVNKNHSPLSPQKFLTDFWGKLQVMAEFKMNKVEPKPMSEHKPLKTILERHRKDKERKEPWQVFPQKNFHSIRHTFATTLLANLPAGKSIADISKVLGHSKVSTTLDLYSHYMPENKNALADAISSIFVV